MNPENKEELRTRIAETARKQIGKPYLYGAAPSAAPRVFDCSSFVQYLYRRIGITLPRNSIDQATVGKKVRQPYRENVRLGDLIFLRGRVGRYNRRFPQGVGHVIVVTGPNEVVHAKYRKVGGADGGSVIRQRLSTVLKRKDITIIRRLI